VLVAGMDGRRVPTGELARPNGKGEANAKWPTKVPGGRQPELRLAGLSLSQLRLAGTPPTAYVGLMRALGRRRRTHTRNPAAAETPSPLGRNGLPQGAVNSFAIKPGP